MIGREIAHYKILRKLGEGGMGEVYLAEDRNLDRRVALKFIPESLQRDSEARERLLREARSVSQLNHRNIVTIFAVEESQGSHFIAMEYVEGKTLAGVISAGTPDVSQVIDWLEQICDGLAAAHMAGIIHRDIKPENIKVTESGEIKIMDFGLAKWQGATQLTQYGSTPGTAAYMSPEQVQAQDVDYRSDLWSVGVVLFELLTGETPFKGEHQAAIAYAIVNEPHPSLSSRGVAVPEGLTAVLDRCLAKNPDQRYETATALKDDLAGIQSRGSSSARPTSPGIRRFSDRRRLALPALAVIILIALVLAVRGLWPEGSPSGTNGRILLAVLPFQNLGDTKQEYFADGITDEIMARLAGLSGLAIISRKSAMRYKGSTLSAREIGRKLGVEYILEGTVRWDRSGDADRVRIIPQLVRTTDDTQVWSDSYEQPLERVFAVQTDIANAVTSALRIALGAHDTPPSSAGGTENLAAYDYYLRANDYFNRGFLEEDIRLAIALYKRALALDSQYVPALAKLSQSHAKLYWWGFDPSPACLKEAYANATRALDLDRDSPEAHVALGYYYYWGLRDYDSAIREFDAARKRQPNSGEIFEATAYVHRRMGKFQLAVTEFKRALESDPLSAVLAYELGNTFYRTRDWGNATKYFDRAISLSPDWAPSFSLKARLRVYADGDTLGAREVLEDASRVVPEAREVLGEDWVWVSLMRDDPEAALDQVTVVGGDTTFYYLESARIYESMGDLDRARTYSDSARIDLERLIETEPETASLHRYLGIALAGLGREEEALAEIALAQELLPMSLDAFHGGPCNIEAEIRILTLLGRTDQAIDRMDTLLKTSAGLLSLPYLKLAPEFSDLRSNPRFRKLLSGGKEQLPEL